MKSITITVPLPDKALSPNARCHWRRIAEEKRMARDVANIKARFALNLEPAPRWDKARAQVTFYWPDKRRRDADNAMASLKAVVDGIADAGIVANDSGIWPERPVFETDARNPRVVITLTEETE